MLQVHNPCSEAPQAPRISWSTACEPQPLPARPSVSPSSETGKRGTCCDGSCSLSTATTGGRRTAFTNTARNVSRGVCNARHPAVQVSGCSAQRTSPNSGSERLLAERKEKAVRSACRHCASRICLQATRIRLGFG